MTSLAAPTSHQSAAPVPGADRNDLVAAVLEKRDAVSPDLFLSDHTECELHSDMGAMIQGVKSGGLLPVIVPGVGGPTHRPSMLAVAAIAPPGNAPTSASPKLVKAGMNHVRAGAHTQRGRRARATPGG